MLMDPLPQLGQLEHLLVGQAGHALGCLPAPSCLKAPK
jgi:hypothetical protein